MKFNLNYRHLLLAAAISISIVAAAIIPGYAADLAGKTVTEVAISGNTSVATSVVTAAIKTKAGDALEEAKIKADLQAIFDLGYFADVVANFTQVPEGVKVVYSVLENPPVQSIQIKGNTKVKTEKLLSMITVTKGSVLNSQKLGENMRAIENYYHDQGYILAKVSDVSMKPGGVLAVTINEGMLEGITIKGNDKTKPYVITREMKLKVGEPFNAKDARRSMQKVYNLGFFEDVNMKLNPGKEPNAIVLETNVVEQKTGTFSIGAGYSKADGMIGIIELGDNNFRGTGDKAKIHWEFGGNADSYKNYQFSYTRPWLDDKQTSLGFSIYNMTNQYNDYYDNSNTIRSTYDKQYKGWDVTLGRPQGEYLQNYITFKNRKDTYVKYISGPVDYGATSGANYDPNYANYVPLNFGVTHSITLTRVFDSRDNVFNATEGARYSFSAEFAGKGMGGDFNFNKYTVEGRQYLKVGHAQVVAMRLMAGYGVGNMPESGRFAVGGAESLRGYDDDQFKGHKMLATTVEYRFPVAKKVQGVVFGDAGNAWDGEGYKLDNLKASVGVGVRVDTPIGPIRLDAGKGEMGTKIHFSFGGQF